MKIISWNVNGVRSVYKHGFSMWLSKSRADIVCLQEIKAQKEQIPEKLFSSEGYHLYFHQAEKKGYSGVAVLAKKEPLQISYNLGLERFDKEGRLIHLRYKNFSFINVYMPHGGRFKENLIYKLESYKNLFRYLRGLKDKNIIIAGDFNIAHEEIDLARPDSNKSNIMFTPEERKQLDTLISDGFVDTFRKFHKEGGKYTWWPYMAKARERNLGWRIDYIFVSNSLSQKLKNSFIFNDVLGSDHCPLGVEMDRSLSGHG